MLRIAQRACPLRSLLYPQEFDVAIGLTGPIEPDVSNPIMKYGREGAGQSLGSGDRHTSWACAPDVARNATEATTKADHHLTRAETNIATLQSTDSLSSYERRLPRSRAHSHPRFFGWPDGKDQSEPP